MSSHTASLFPFLKVKEMMLAKTIKCVLINILDSFEMYHWMHHLLFGVQEQKSHKRDVLVEVFACPHDGHALVEKGS